MTRGKDLDVKIAIVISCYNEAAVIADTIKRVEKLFSQTKNRAGNFEIIVIDDSSRDDSAKIARQTGATVISHLLNQGQGLVVLTGLEYAQENGFNFVVAIDGDGQHSPNDALKCLEFAIKNEADLTIGSRLINPQGMGRIKVIGNKGLSMITWVLFGVKTTDSQSGLRVFSRRAIEKLRWQTTGYEFCSEMIWRAKQAKLKIAEVPIKAIYTDHSKNKGQSNWNGVHILKTLVKQRVLEILE